MDMRFSRARVTRSYEQSVRKRPWCGCGAAEATVANCSRGLAGSWPLSMAGAKRDAATLPDGPDPASERMLPCFASSRGGLGRLGRRQLAHPRRRSRRCAGESPVMKLWCGRPGRLRVVRFSAVLSVQDLIAVLCSNFSMGSRARSSLLPLVAERVRLARRNRKCPGRAGRCGRGAQVALRGCGTRLLGSPKQLAATYCAGASRTIVSRWCRC